MSTGIKNGMFFLSNGSLQSPTADVASLPINGGIVNIEPDNATPLTPITVTDLAFPASIEAGSMEIIVNQQSNDDIEKCVVLDNNAGNNFTGKQYIPANSAALVVTGNSKQYAFNLCPTHEEQREIFINQNWRTIVGVFGWIVNSSQFYNGYYQSGGADGEELAYYLPLENRQYSLYLVGLRSTDNGKIDFYLDGVVSTAGIDTFGGASFNYSYGPFNFTPAFNGEHKIGLKVNGKNASSSGYRMRLTYAMIKPTTYRDRWV